MLFALAVLAALAVGPPDWVAPPPGTYGEVMALTGIVQVDGTELASPDDLVAAFVGGEVRAVTGPSLVGGRRVFTLAVAGDAGDGEVIFRAYDAAADVVWDLQPGIPFDPSESVGSAAGPLVWTPIAGGGPPVWEPDPAGFEGSMSVTARLLRDGEPVAEAGALVGAFVDGRVRGSAEVQDVGAYGPLAFLSVYGDGAEAGTVAFRVYLPSADRTFDVETTLPLTVGASLGSVSAPVDLVVRDAAGLTLDVGVWLQGAYAEGAMRTDLTTVLPQADPYGLGASVATADFFLAGAAGQSVVDWVWVELRTGPAATDSVAGTAALLLRDGAVVASDAVSAPSLPGVPSASYYVVVGHRNHASAMTAAAVDCSAGVCVADLRTGSAYGADGRTDVGAGAWALWAADGSGDGLVSAPDFNVYSSAAAAGTIGYADADYSLDGLVTAPDFNVYNSAATAGAGTAVPEN